MTALTVDCPARLAADSSAEYVVMQAELRASSYTALRSVCCCLQDGRIVLCGTVPSFYLKQVAQCLLLKRWGSEVALENRLEVASSETRSQIV